MSYDIGPKIGIEGEKEFKNAISDINNNLKTLGTEMKAVTSAYDKNDRSAEKLTAQNEVLNKQINDQKLKLEGLKSALSKSADEVGENDKKTEKWQQEVNKATAELNKMERQLDDNNAALKDVERGFNAAGNRVDKFGKEIKQTANETDKASDQSSRLSDIFKGGFFANIASNALSTVTNKIKELLLSAMETADQLVKLSSQTGLSTTELQKMAYVGDDLGVSLEVQTGALRKLTKNMGTAQIGTKTTADAFAALGVSVVDQNGQLRDAKTVYYEVLEALGSMGNETQRDAYAQQVLGKSAAELTPLIEAGSEAIAKLGDEAARTGAIMSENTVVSLDTVGDKLDHFWQIAGSSIANLAYAAVNMGGVWDKYYEYVNTAEEETVPAVENMGAAIGMLEAEFAAAKLTIDATLQSLIGGWQSAPEVVALSAEAIAANLQSQLDYMLSYRNNLDALISRAIPGVDMSALIRSLSDGTLESAQVLAGLSTATDNELTQIAQLYAAKGNSMDSFTDGVAATQVDYDKQLADLVTNTQKAVDDMDLSDEAKISAVNTINGYINGVKSKSGSLNLAMTTAAQDALKAWKKVFKEKSPSREMAKSGVNAILGNIKGVESKKTALIAEYARTGQLAINSMTAALSGNMAVPSSITSNLSGLGAGTSGSISSPNNTGGIIQNVTINSPTPLSPSQIARESKNAMRRLAWA